MIKRILTAIIIIFSFSLLFSEKSSKDIQEDIDKKNKEAKLLQREIDTLANKIQDKNIQSKAIADRLSDMKKKIELTGNLIDLLKKDENNIDLTISKTEDTINKNKIRLNQLENKFSKMIIHLYKSKSDNYLDILLSSENWEDIIYKIKYLDIISNQHQKIKEDIELIINQLDYEITELTKKLLNKKNERKDKSNQIAKYGSSSKGERNKLEEIKNQKIDLEKSKKKKKNKLIEINKLLEKLYVNKDDAKNREEKLRRIREEKKRKEQEYAQRSKGFSGMKGQLDWPVKGTIIKNFGIDDNDGIEDMNIWVEIKTKGNEPVKTVFDGIVATIDYNPVYNTYIIIDHGGGYSTLYANLDDNSIQIASQAYIESETIIGNVLDDPNNKKQTYGLLYFGVIGTGNNQRATPYNPREWIK